MWRKEGCFLGQLVLATGVELSVKWFVLGDNPPRYWDGKFLGLLRKGVVFHSVVLVMELLWSGVLLHWTKDGQRGFEILKAGTDRYFGVGLAAGGLEDP